jgi:hypothetical protein
MLIVAVPHLDAKRQVRGDVAQVGIGESHATIRPRGNTGQVVDLKTKLTGNLG